MACSDCPGQTPFMMISNCIECFSLSLNHAFFLTINTKDLATLKKLSIFKLLWLVASATNTEWLFISCVRLKAAMWMLLIDLKEKIECQNLVHFINMSSSAIYCLKRCPQMLWPHYVDALLMMLLQKCIKNTEIKWLPGIRK